MEEAAALIRGRELAVLPVVEKGELVGVLTRDDLLAYERIAEVLGEAARDVILEMSPHDGMSSGLRGAYMLAGASALQCTRAALRAAGLGPPGSILDFGCGHGRVLRLLKAAYPDARLGGCDIDRDGVDFCARTFGAVPYYSSVDPREIEISETFDVIWCGSFFTHLSAERWPGFLGLLESCLTPERGVLVFTTLGGQSAASLRSLNLGNEEAAAMLATFEAAGFAFSDYPGRASWGLAMASPRWVRDQIAESTSLDVVLLAERAWQPPRPRQDVVACARSDG